MSFHIRAALNLFAGFLIAMHIAVLLHEVGHALGSLASGRSVMGIFMFTPFPAGYVVPKALDSSLHVWGGVAFGSLIAAVPLAVAWFFASRTVLRFCALLTAAFCFAHNGFYLLIGGFIPFGDAADMIALGAPRWVLPLLGLPLLAAFLLVLASAIGIVGLRTSDPAAKWILPVEAGLMLCPAVMIIPLQFSRSQTATKQAMLFLLAGFAASFLWATLRARRSALTSAIPPQLPQTWTCTLGLFAGAVGVLAFEWFALLHATHR
jgi:hypothetical protein